MSTPNVAVVTDTARTERHARSSASVHQSTREHIGSPSLISNGRWACMLG
jgi:hypothetical protein